MSKKYYIIRGPKGDEAIDCLKPAFEIAGESPEKASVPPILKQVNFDPKISVTSEKPGNIGPDTGKRTLFLFRRQPVVAFAQPVAELLASVNRTASHPPAQCETYTTARGQAVKPLDRYCS